LANHTQAFCGDEEWPELFVPDTVRGVLMSFIDRLAPERQLVLKVCAVLDNPFEYAELYAVYPQIQDLPQLWSNLDMVLMNEFLEVVSGSTPENLVIRFPSHALRRLSASLLLQSQRDAINNDMINWKKSMKMGLQRKGSIVEIAEGPAAGVATDLMFTGGQ
jgi:hypothetical protein